MIVYKCKAAEGILKEADELLSELSGDAIDAGDLALRVLLVPFEPSLRRVHGDAAFEFLADRREVGDDRLAPHGVKFINDGSEGSMPARR